MTETTTPTPIPTPENIIEARTAETRYDTGHDTERGRAYLVIRTYHNVNRKAFASSVRRVVTTPYGRSETFSFGEPDAVVPAAVPVARYSEKALLRAHADYIVRHDLDRADMLAPLIEWAKGA